MGREDVPAQGAERPSGSLFFGTFTFHKEKKVTYNFNFFLSSECDTHFLFDFFTLIALS